MNLNFDLSFGGLIEVVGSALKPTTGTGRYISTDGVYKLASGEGYNVFTTQKPAIVSAEYVSTDGLYMISSGQLYKTKE